MGLPEELATIEGEELIAAGEEFLAAQEDALRQLRGPGGELVHVRTEPTSVRHNYPGLFAFGAAVVERQLRTIPPEDDVAQAAVMDAISHFLGGLGRLADDKQMTALFPDLQTPDQADQ